MQIGTSLFLLAVGAILAFAVQDQISGIDLTLTMMECDITVTAFPASGGAPVSVRREIRGLTTDRLESFVFPGGRVATSRLRVEVFLPYAGPRAHVELRELVLR